MSCTIIYVEPTEALMGQAKKRRLLSLLKKWWDNNRGGVITHYFHHKGNQAIISTVMFLDLRDTSQPFLRVFHHWSPPTPWFPLLPSYSYSPLKTITSLRDTSQNFFRVFIVESPLTTVSQRLSNSTSVSSSPWATKISSMM